MITKSIILKFHDSYLYCTEGINELSYQQLFADNSSTLPVRVTLFGLIYTVYTLCINLCTSYKAMKGISLVNLVEHMASDYRLTNGRVKTILTLATIPFP